MFNLADAIQAYVPLPELKYEHTHWVRGATPLSTQPVVVAALVAYLVVIFGIQEIMRNRKPLKLQVPFMIHNVYLTTGSGVLLLLMLEEILPKLFSHGTFYAICNSGSWTEVCCVVRVPEQMLTSLA